MLCPKCNNVMQAHTVVTLAGTVTIDRCSYCTGIWFDTGEAEILKKDWMSEFLDSGNEKSGKYYNEFDDIDCPRCHKKMLVKQDPDQPHIKYEVCEEHGMFMDAKEFTDYKSETLLDFFKKMIRRLIE